MDNASEAVGVTTIIHTRYDEYIPYGNLISQSILPGTKLSDKDDKTIMVVYSLGLPYLKDLRGTTNEGELQKLFFDEFQSKGANITYTVNYVQSSSPKGTVIYQSTYESLVPLNFNVRLTISLGDGTSDDPSVELPSGKPKD
jgi:serine/threonine-protein kinase